MKIPKKMEVNRAKEQLETISLLQETSVDRRLQIRRNKIDYKNRMSDIWTNK